MSGSMSKPNSYIYCVFVCVHARVYMHMHVCVIRVRVCLLTLYFAPKCSWINRMVKERETNTNSMREGERGRETEWKREGEKEKWKQSECPATVHSSLVFQAVAEGWSGENKQSYINPYLAPRHNISMIYNIKFIHMIYLTQPMHINHHLRIWHCNTSSSYFPTQSLSVDICHKSTNPL